MSSAIFVTFDDDTQPSEEDWLSFCADQGLAYSPQTVGGRTWYGGESSGNPLDHGPVEVNRNTYRGSLAYVTFSTFFMGPAMPAVADVARAFWLRFGGQVEAADELRPLFAPVP